MIVVFCTCPNGEELARKIVERKLAACINIFKVKSIYLWRGNVEESEEDLLVIKTKEDLLEELKRFIRENHPYEIPEIIYFKVESEENYKRWLEDELKRKSD